MVFPVNEAQGSKQALLLGKSSTIYRYHNLDCAQRARHASHSHGGLARAPGAQVTPP